MCRPCNNSQDISNANHCSICPTAQRCSECETVWFPTYMQDGCMLPIYNCQANPSEYSNDGSFFYCPQCTLGTYPAITDEGDSVCMDCPKVSEGGVVDDIGYGCISCITPDSCNLCTPGFIM